MSGPRVFRRAADLRRALGAGRGPVGFVPTMGALHEGHLSLARRSLKGNTRTVVSVFVNPTQFGPREDFKSYPRELESDRRLLAPLGPVLVYAPAAEEIYPAGFSTTVTVGGPLDSVLEAAWRPGHFAGVATVVARLFALARPDRAYFGLKDYQQYQVVRRMVGDLGFPVALEGCPIVREADGLAMSSRNRRLGPSDRPKAAAIHRALGRAAALAAEGERSPARLRAAGLAVLAPIAGLKVQYFEVADADSLLPLKRLEGPARVLAACLLGGVRLIDNLPLRPPRLRSRGARAGKGNGHA